MKVERILTATDFSRSAEAAVRRAALLAQATGAALEIVHAVHLNAFSGVWRKLAADEGLTEARVLGDAARRLDDLAADVVERTGAARPATRVLHGRPPLALAEQARESAADLVVVGAHGEHLLYDLFVGATALKLLRLTTVPLLMVKQMPPFEYERVLVATDFSIAARAAADLAARLLPAAELHLFHAYEVPFEREMYYAGAEDEAVDHYRRLGEAEAQHEMAAFVATLETPGRWVRRVRHGYAPALINRQAAELGADLLVIGAHRQSGIAAALLGSVAAHLVIESRGDLLMAPTVADQSG
ncbi:MAG: universal stress protein [Sulfuritalea sp.]|nr:universal stress protein [Sulfuritalea sp.]